MPLFGRTTAEDEARAAAWRDWIAQRHPLAIASVALGVFSLIDLGVLILPELAGVVLGILALRQLRSGGPRPLGHRLAWLGIVLSLLSLAAAAALYLYRPSRS